MAARGHQNLDPWEAERGREGERAGTIKTCSLGQEANSMPQFGYGWSRIPSSVAGWRSIFLSLLLVVSLKVMQQEEDLRCANRYWLPGSKTQVLNNAVY